MDIGLMDVDSHNFPNLALMKISAYEKSLGNSVKWWNGFEHYDVVYKAKVFDETYSNDDQTCIDADKVIQGGTGYNLHEDLKPEIEYIYPDYSIYNENRAIGFLTRGCPRNCKFCIVGEKEGLTSHQVNNLTNFWHGQDNIEIMDANLTAADECINLFKDLIKSKAKINFNQGLDIRFMTDEKAYLLNLIKTKMIHFAWDNYEFKTYELLKSFRPMFNKSERDIRVYVLVNFNTTHEQDLERIYKLKELKYDPYVMVFEKPTALKETKNLQRWCNNKFIFRTCDKFEDYNC